MNKIPFKIVHNPRKENNDLGDIACERCGEKSSAYLSTFDHSSLTGRLCGLIICKRCLLEGIDMINKAILSTVVKKKKIVEKN